MVIPSAIEKRVYAWSVSAYCRARGSLSGMRHMVSMARGSSMVDLQTTASTSQKSVLLPLNKAVFTDITFIFICECLRARPPLGITSNV